MISQNIELQVIESLLLNFNKPMSIITNNRMEGNGSKRNYVKRKRSIKESTMQIASVLQVIVDKTGGFSSPEDIKKKASEYAQSIEASCWSRKAKYSDDEFQALTKEKTNELIKSLIYQSGLSEECFNISCGHERRSPIEINQMKEYAPLKKSSYIQSSHISENSSDSLLPESASSQELVPQEIKSVPIKLIPNNILTERLPGKFDFFPPFSTHNNHAENIIIPGKVVPSEPSNEDLFNSLWTPASNQRNRLSFI